MAAACHTIFRGASARRISFRSISGRGQRDRFMGRRGVTSLLSRTDMVYGYRCAPPIRPTPAKSHRPSIWTASAGARTCHAAARGRPYVSIFGADHHRPRALGIMTTCPCIEQHIPVPMIGDGSNHYQMISVIDAQGGAAIVTEGVVNGEFNPVEEPTTVRELARKGLEAAGYRSFLVSTLRGLHGVLAVLE